MKLHNIKINPKAWTSTFQWIEVPLDGGGAVDYNNLLPEVVQVSGNGSASSSSSSSSSSSGNGGSPSGTVIVNPKSITVTHAMSPYTALSNYDIYILDTSGGAITVNLSGTTAQPARISTYIRVGAGTATLTPNGSDTILGSASFVLSFSDQSIQLYPIGTDWTNPNMPSEAIGDFNVNSHTVANVGELDLIGSTSGSLVKFKAAASTLAMNVTWPNSNGLSGYVLSNNGSGNLSWVPVGTGSVTSVGVSGGTTGLTTTGGPITTTGTITLGGDLIVSNGGTGRTSLYNHEVIIGAGTGAVNHTTQSGGGIKGVLVTDDLGTSDPSWNAHVQLGRAGLNAGQVELYDGTGGTGSASILARTQTATNNYYLPDLGTSANILVASTNAGSTSLGTATLGAGGTVVVATTLVKATSKIFLTYQNFVGATGSLSAPAAAIVPGVSFTVTSSNVGDLSTFYYLLINI